MLSDLRQMRKPAVKGFVAIIEKNRTWYPSACPQYSGTHSSETQNSMTQDSVSQKSESQYNE
uniref:Uncharacterized protein n=1 Tax=Romanomermis culicivorax TaxID=13658 RepID=A0A915IF65_ROMCU